MRKSNSSEYKTPHDSHKPQIARSAGKMQARAKEKTAVQFGATEEEAWGFPQMPVNSRYYQETRRRLMELLLSLSGDRYLGRHLMHTEEHWNPVASIIDWGSDKDMNTEDQDLMTTVLPAHSAAVLRPTSTTHLSTNSPIRRLKVVGLNCGDNC